MVCNNMNQKLMHYGLVYIDFLDSIGKLTVWIYVLCGYERVCISFVDAYVSLCMDLRRGERSVLAYGVCNP